MEISNNNENQINSSELDSLKALFPNEEIDANSSPEEAKKLIEESIKQEKSSFLEENKDFLWQNYKEVSYLLKQIQINIKWWDLSSFIEKYKEFSNIISWFDWIKNVWWNNLKPEDTEKINNKKLIEKLKDFLEKLKWERNDTEEKTANIRKQEKEEEEKNPEQWEEYLASLIEWFPIPWEESEKWWETA